MKKHALLKSVISGSLALVICASSSLAQTAPVGILGLYQGDAMEFDETRIANLGCTFRRSGLIGAAQGDIGLEQPTQFVLLACDASILEDTARRADFAALATSNTTIAVLEGNLTDLPVPDPAGEISQRQYILKISNYNNADVEGRASELEALNVLAGQRKDTYITESSVSVNHASGMPTPDEVVVIYYDDPATGDRFRDQNGDVLSLIGAFNKAHLVNSIYYVGKALR